MNFIYCRASLLHLLRSFWCQLMHFNQLNLFLLFRTLRNDYYNQNYIRLKNMKNNHQPNKQLRPKSSSFYTTYLKKAQKNIQSPSLNYHSISHNSNFNSLIQVKKSLGVKKHKYSKSQKEINKSNLSKNSQNNNQRQKFKTIQCQYQSSLEKKIVKNFSTNQVFQNEKICNNIAISLANKQNPYSLSKQDIKVSLNQERQKQKIQKQKNNKQKKLKERQKMLQKQRKRRFLNPYQSRNNQGQSSDRLNQLKYSASHNNKNFVNQVHLKKALEDIYVIGDRSKLKSTNAKTTKSKSAAYQSLKNLIPQKKQGSKKKGNSNQDSKTPHNYSLSNLARVGDTEQYLKPKVVREKPNSAMGNYTSKTNVIKHKQKDAYNSIKNKNQSKSMYDQLQIENQQKIVNDKQQKQNKVRNVIFSFSHRTKQGVQYNNPNKTNQDSFLALQNYHNYAKIQLQNRQNDEQLHLFCVADGHGIHGHHVSQTIIQYLPSILKNQIKKQDFNIQKSLFKSYQLLQEILTENKKRINIQSSGSTMVTALIKGNTLVCANAGDSRAILARQIDKKCWQIVYLSEDHKPSTQKEKKRILRCGGKVRPFRDQNGVYVGPHRVWLPNKNLQGLAMSRSLGDNISKPVGVTHQPQLIKVNLQTRDKFLLIASDGVWEFLSNQQVLELIVPFYRENKLEQACDALMKLAYKKWTVQDSLVVDDITFILVFFWK